MFKSILLLGFCAIAVFGADAQADGKNKKNKVKKNIFYAALGSNRIWYTRSNIQVIRQSSPSYNFTLSKVKAKDEGGLIFDTAPQFTYTVGYYFTNKKFGVEYQLDHIKYFVTKNQKVHMKGSIDGTVYDKDTTLTADFFVMEHSDGANYGMLNFVKWFSLVQNPKLVYPELLVKGGVGLVNPKTNSTILGFYRDDIYHISGYVVALESGLRIHVGKNFFVTTSFKGAFANYNDFLISGGFGRQKWLSAQFNYLIGGQFPL